jgi:hypothetical protein
MSLKRHSCDKAGARAAAPARARIVSATEVKSEYVSESRAMEGKFGGCRAAAPRNFSDADGPDSSENTKNFRVGYWEGLRPMARA